jgi:FkbM family methyltransferase
MSFLKSIAARLPEQWQTELKRVRLGRQIARGDFVTDEAEFAMLPRFLRAGDWAIDIGANLGHYTKQMSDLVGPGGRVLAFEPVPTTFSLLAANVGRFQHANVSLFNAAVSDSMKLVGMSIPNFDSGLVNYYEAHLSSAPDARLQVLTMSLDEVSLPQRVALVKIDAEGHEPEVLAGMRQLVQRDRPALIIETFSDALADNCRAQGYAVSRVPGSSNIVCVPEPRDPQR